MKALSALKIIQPLVKSRLLTCEGEIISFLIDNGPSRPRNILYSSSYSHVAVFNKLKDMTNDGILKRKNNHPSKMSIYELSDDLMCHILDIELSSNSLREFKSSDIYKTLIESSEIFSD
jgi:hypothetical protein